MTSAPNPKVDELIGLAEPDYSAAMALPQGMTCADCVHIARCDGFGFTIPEATSCDFYPSRFRALASQEQNDV